MLLSFIKRTCINIIHAQKLVQITILIEAIYPEKIYQADIDSYFVSFTVPIAIFFIAWKYIN